MQGPAYDATFPEGQRSSDVTVMVVMAAIGALYFHVERKEAPASLQAQEG
jgi:hypothetical protein